MSHLDEGQLNALLDGELDEAERKAAEAHLESCAECRREYTEARALMAGADDLIAAVALPPRSGVAPVAPKARPATFRWRNVAWAASILFAVGLGWLARADELNSPVSGRYAKDVGDAAAAPATRRTLPSSEPTPLLDSLRAQEKERAKAGKGGGVASRIGSADQKVAQPTAPPRQDESPKAEVALSEVPVKPEAAPAPVMKQNAPVVANTDALRALTNPADKATNDRENSAAASAEGQLARKAAREERPAQPPEEAVATTAQAVSPAPSKEPGATLFMPQAAAPAGRRAREVGAFRATPMEEAVRILGGSIRLVDGMTPTRVMVGSSVLAGSADPQSEIVRVVYDDPPGRELWLDQQRSESGTNEADGAGLAATTLLPGDTLVVAYRSGAKGLRWIHQSGFRLGLTGFLPADSLRALARRVQ